MSAIKGKSLLSSRPSLIFQKYAAIFSSFAVILFLFYCPPDNRQAIRIIYALGLFVLLYLVGMFKNSSYRKELASSNKEEIKEYIRLGLCVEQNNNGIPGARESSGMLFSVVEDELLIYAGNLNHDFYEYDTIQKSLEKILDAGHKIRLICAPREECDVETKTVFSFQNNPKYDFKLVHDKERPELHFMVVDKRHLRLERKHPPDKFYEAQITYNNNLDANFHKYLFVKRWKELTGDELD